MDPEDLLRPPSTLNYPQPEPDPLSPIEVSLGDDEGMGDEGHMRMPNGDVVVDLGGDVGENEGKEEPAFDDNLAMHMTEQELDKISGDLMRGIDQDETSRADWLDNHAEAIKLLGTIIEKSGSDAGTTTTVFEGQYKTHHPLLLEAALLFQANARASLLPAAGPVKVRDDQTPGKPPAPPPMPMMPPGMPGMGHNGGPQMDNPMAMGSPEGMPPEMGQGEMPPGGMMADGGYINSYADGGQPLPGAPNMAGAMPQGMPPVNINVGQQAPNVEGQQPQPTPPGMPMPGMMPPAPAKPERDAMATALERDMNHYLTTVAQEYYPDTDRMLFSVGFGGLGIKKVYNCPIRRRPVSESVAVQDFIVSNAFATISSMPRVTHRINMRPAVVRRMQLLGAYRDVPLGAPSEQDNPDSVKRMQADVMGVSVTMGDPADNDRELYETYCELELDKFAPPQFKGKELPLPYKVTIDKRSRKVLEVRRNWREKDEQCLAREYFVEYVYVQGFGFYPIGLLHILGNTTRTLTMAWREFIDSGMFANFPGFLFAKGAGRQLTNQFRVPPGGGVGLDVGLQRMQDAVMPLPYKDLGPGFAGFVQHVEEYGKQLGGTANTNVGEGRQDAPVGTTLALIEQATKPLGAVLKRLHSAQSKEFQLLAERFREDPEAFWRFNKKPAMQWRKDQFLQALDDFDLVPVSDPNNPTNMHRLAKASALQQLVQAAPQLFDLQKVAKRIADGIDIENIEDLFAPPQAAPMDPKIQGEQMKAQAAQQKSMADLMIERMRIMDREKDRASKERLAQIDHEIEKIQLAQTLAIHSSQAELGAAERALQLQQSAADAEMQHRGSEAERQHAAQMAHQERSQRGAKEAANLLLQHHHKTSEREHKAKQAEADRIHAIQLAQHRASQTRKPQ